MLRRALEKDVKRRLRDLGDGVLEINDALTHSLIESRTPTDIGAPSPSRGPTKVKLLKRLSINIPPETPVFLAENLDNTLAMAPDGSRLVYLADSEGSSCLAVRELDQRVIPISPRLGDDFDLLLVTGPNTGGKTVLLKTIGICQLMAQSGMHIPARPGSQVTVYEHLFADIGDEQSIQQSLSTFSAHMQHVIQILKQTNAQTLVLLDELGAGTDPTEGASLATAILDELLRSQGHIIATTHLGQLKTFAFARARAENASVQFDSQSLRPTYKLFIGTPGSSNALAIARRLGMPERVIRSAHDLLALDSDGSSELINQVQTTRELAERKRQQAENMLNEAQGVHQEANRRLAELREERKRLRGQADRQVDDTMRRVRATIQGFDRQMANAPKPWHAFVQDLVEDINQLASSTPLAERHQRFTEGLKKGDSVYVLPLRRSAIVDRIRRKRQSVQLFLDGKQIEVSFEQICQDT